MSGGATCTRDLAEGWYGCLLVYGISAGVEGWFWWYGPWLRWQSISQLLQVLCGSCDKLCKLQFGGKLLIAVASAVAGHILTEVEYVLCFGEICWGFK